jgi:hypothetical protein
MQAAQAQADTHLVVFCFSLEHKAILPQAVADAGSPGRLLKKLRSGRLWEGHDFSRAVKFFATSRSSTPAVRFQQQRLVFWAPCLSPP